MSETVNDYGLEFNEGMVHIECPTCLTVTHRTAYWYKTELEDMIGRCTVCGSRGHYPHLDVEESDVVKPEILYDDDTGEDEGLPPGD